MLKSCNVPVEPARRSENDRSKCRSHVSMPNMHTDAHGIAIHMNTAGNAQETISTGTRHYQTSVLGVNATVRL